MNQKSGIHYNTPKIREQDKKTVGLILMSVILTVTQMKKKIFLEWDDTFFRCVSSTLTYFWTRLLFQQQN